MTQPQEGNTPQVSDHTEITYPFWLERPIMSALITTSPGAPNLFSPDRVIFHPVDALGTSLLQLCTTPVVVPYSDRETVRIPHFSDFTPAGFVAEGAEIPSGELGEEDEVTITSRKLAQIHSLSNELADTPDNGIEAVLGTSMVNSLIASANTAFLTNVGTPAGLNTLTGRTEAGALDANLDPFIDAFAVIESEGGNVADTWIIAHPLDWAVIAKLKASTGSNQSLIVSDPANPGTRNIDGIPVYTSRFAERGTITIGDRGNIPSAYSEVVLEADKSALFSFDSVMFRSKHRIGWNVMNPARIATLTIPTSGA